MSGASNVEFWFRSRNIEPDAAKVEMVLAAAKASDHVLDDLVHVPLGARRLLLAVLGGELVEESGDDRTDQRRRDDSEVDLLHRLRSGQWAVLRTVRDGAPRPARAGHASRSMLIMVKIDHGEV